MPLFENPWPSIFYCGSYGILLVKFRLETDMIENLWVIPLEICTSLVVGVSETEGV